MSRTDSQYVVVGKLGAAYGIKGWLKVISFTKPTLNILDYSPWFLETAQDWLAITPEDGRAHGKSIVVKLPGLETPEEARLWTGRTIAILRTQLPALKKNEYYWHQLEGLTVINQEGKTLGKIIYLMETGSNDVLVVKGEIELAIPYLLGETICNIDLDKGEMVVNWDIL